MTHQSVWLIACMWSPAHFLVWDSAYGKVSCRISPGSCGWLGVWSLHIFMCVLLWSQAVFPACTGWGSGALHGCSLTSAVQTVVRLYIIHLLYGTSCSYADLSQVSDQWCSRSCTARARTAVRWLESSQWPVSRVFCTRTGTMFMGVCRYMYSCTQSSVIVINILYHEVYE